MDDITKLIDLEDSDLIIEGPTISKGVKLLTITKKLQPAFCPICGSRMYSRGIYTRIVNHPVLQDGTQLVLKLKQRRWKCLNPVCNNTCNDTFSFVDPSRRQDVTEPYFAGIPKAERFRVKYLITDMYRPYIGYIDKYFPNAVSIVDSFHVVKMINGKMLGYIRKLQNKYRHLDEERHERLEQEMGRRIDFVHSREYYLLKNFRWLILKNHDDIHYSGRSRYDYKLRRYVTLGEIEDMLFDIDSNLRYIRNLKER